MVAAEGGRVLPRTGGDAMHYLAGLIMVLQVALWFVLEKRLSLRALDWFGWCVWALGMVMILLSIATLRRRGNVPPGSSFVDTGSLVTDGIFGIVRHPLYLGWSLMYFVPLLFNPRWETASLALAGVFAVQVVTREEEKALLDRFGEAYRCYAESVPGMNLLKGLWTAIRRRRRT